MSSSFAFASVGDVICTLSQAGSADVPRSVTIPLGSDVSYNLGEMVVRIQTLKPANDLLAQLFTNASVWFLNAKEQEGYIDDYQVSCIRER